MIEIAIRRQIVLDLRGCWARTWTRQPDLLQRDGDENWEWADVAPPGM